VICHPAKMRAGCILLALLKRFEPEKTADLGHPLVISRGGHERRFVYLAAEMLDNRIRPRRCVATDGRVVEQFFRLVTLPFAKCGEVSDEYGVEGDVTRQPSSSSTGLNPIAAGCEHVTNRKTDRKLFVPRSQSHHY
jgi:hypothetical protein